MCFHGIDRDTELVRNFLVAPAGCRTGQNLPLPVSQDGKEGFLITLDLRRCSDAAREGIRHEPWRHMFSSVRGPDDAQKLGIVGVFENIPRCPGLHGRDNPHIFIIDR